MRRRDATYLTSLSHTDRWRSAFVSAALSVGIHCAILAAAVSITVSRLAPERLIRVSLAPGGGTEAATGGSGNGAHDEVASLAMPDPPHDAAVRATRAGVPKNPTLPKKARIRRPPIDRPEDTTLQEVPSASDAATSAKGGEQAATGQGEGVGLGSGSGLGFGGGSGGGEGTGSGGGDQRAHCVYCPEPHYPTVAQRRGWEGTVRVGLSVLADGTVEEASLRQSSGYTVLDRAAVEVARQSRFTPPGSLGLPTPLRGRIEYRFELSKVQ